MFEIVKSAFAMAAFARLASASAGNIAVTFAFSSFAVVASAGGAVDYVNLSTTHQRYQAAADNAALAAAKEFRLGNAAVATVEDIANIYATNTLEDAADGATIEPSVDTNAMTVTVDVSGDVETYFMHLFGTSVVKVAASATAKVVGGTPICVIGLDAKANFTVAMDMRARLEAPRCAVYSNAQSPNGLMAKNYATLTAAFICSAGGKDSPGPGSFSPTPQTDCPVLPDPLANRPQPAVADCDHTDLAITEGSQTLQPGTYCGGIRIDGHASVTLTSGTYVLKDGPLTVDGGASLDGHHVSLFFAGKGAVLDFRADSSISLTAPNRGSTAGLLAFEARDTPEKQIHEISSNDARMLLGTIYLPRNRLHVAADKPVADRSAYTIVVARLFTLSEGPTMVLNTDYSSTDIPVPDGVGPTKSALLVN